MLPLYLSAKEIMRNKTRFLSVSMVIGLITLLVLFIAALGEGLAVAGKQYIESLDAELIVFQDDVDISIPASRLGRSDLNDIRRVDGVSAVGPIGFATASILLDADTGENLDVSLVGVEPEMPGAPAVFAGKPLISRRANEVVIDQNALDQYEIPVGSTIQIQVVQGTEERVYDLLVVGQTAGKQYQFLPSIFVPLLTWDQIKPQANPGGNNRELTFNIAAVKLAEPAAAGETIPLLQEFVDDIEVTDPVTTYQNVPGYSAQQNTVNTQQGFTLLIAVLVIGGFFQIQTLQKVGQIGMLKAIGASNWLVATSLIVQVVMTTIIGIGIGGAASYLLSLALPAGIPIKFEGPGIITAVVALLLIGPIGGLVSIRTLLKVEPLTALGLGA